MSEVETSAEELAPEGVLGQDQQPVPGGLVAGLLDQIVEEYAPETATFDVRIAIGGEVVKIPFKRLTDGKEMEDLQADAAAWARSMMPKRHLKTKVQPMSSEMRRWFVPRPEILAKVYVISRLAIHPDFQGEANVMRLFRQAWPIFNSVMHQIDLATTNQIVDVENADYEDEGKGSEATLPTG